MPELAEVKIMSDFINSVVGEEGFFDVLEKSPVSKVKTELDPFKGAVYTMHAKARGTELLLHLEMIGGNVDEAVTKNLLCTMGMSGNWVYVRKDAPQLEKAFKHGHLRFQSTRGNWLILYDPRRFAKWKWVEDFSKGRGPCPLIEYNDFQFNILSNWFNDKYFNKPLSEVMMNQSAFNGVGNYLRAEILLRLDVDPFQAANNLTLEELQNLIKITHMCVRDAYQLGGGQLKDWHNPSGVDAADFNEWMKCYGKMESIVDGSGRKFWYHPKWKSPTVSSNDI
jgi:endonuclease VIII-like 1